MIFVPFHPSQGLGNQTWLLVTGIYFSHFFNKNLCLVNFTSFKAKKILLTKSISSFTFCELDDIPRDTVTLSDELFYYEKSGRNYYFDESLSVFRLFKKFENILIIGNWQSENFIPSRSILSNYLTFDFNKSIISDISETCILNIRGGDYLGLFKSSTVALNYWYRAINYLKSECGISKFAIITDDYLYASLILPCVNILKGDLYHDLSCIASAHYLILSNSSFAIFPAYLNPSARLILAPKLWSPVNIKGNMNWGSPVNFYSFFSYFDYYSSTPNLLHKNKNYIDSVPALSVVESSSFLDVLLKQAPIARSDSRLLIFICSTKKNLIYLIVFIKSLFIRNFFSHE